MARNDSSQAVVDPRLKVIGVKGVRVIDGKTNFEKLSFQSVYNIVSYILQRV